MGHAASQWKHKKYKSRRYIGRYRYAYDEREFVLSTLLRSGKPHNISFESHEAAKQMGWKKCHASRGRASIRKRAR